MTSKLTSRDAILDDGIWLPKFLFLRESQKSKSISPTATLNPATALEGQAFQNSTSPSDVIKKKTLIIDENSLEIYKEYGERVALLKRLQIAGFEIFLRAAPNKENSSNIHKLDKNLKNIDLLHNLSKFDETKDYNELAKQGVARDKVLLLDKEDCRSHIGAIKKAFYQDQFIGPLSGNSLRYNFRVLDSEDEKQIKEKHPNNWGEYYIPKSSKEQRKEFYKTAPTAWHYEYFSICNSEENIKHLARDDQELKKFISDILSGRPAKLIRIFPDKEDLILDQFFGHNKFSFFLDSLNALHNLVSEFPDKKNTFLINLNLLTQKKI